MTQKNDTYPSSLFIISKKLVFQDEGEPIELKEESKSEKGYS